MYVIIADVLEGGVDGGKLERPSVLQEVAVRLVRRRVLAYCWLGRLLDVRLEQDCCEDQGTGERLEVEKNEEAWIGKPFEVGVGV